MPGFVLDLTATPAPEDIALIEDGLTAFNEAARQSGGDDEAPLCVFVRDADGRMIGGATGHTRCGWLYVDCFWLPKDAREDGLGGEVLATAEAEALRRGCARAYLFTYSFQARGFYEKQGYRVFGTQEDFPKGHSKIWMRKDFSASG